MTQRQKDFADYYIETGNITESAVKAGYSATYAGSQGYKLLANVGISKYIEKRMAEKEKDLIARQDEVLQTLTRILRREEKEMVVVTLKTRRSFFDESGKKQIVDEEVPQIVEIPPKLSDVNKAAELLGRRYSLFTDKVDMDISPVIIYGENDLAE